MRSLVEDHVRFTASARGEKLLANWDHVITRFVKIIPTEYKRVIEARRPVRLKVAQ